MTGKSRPMTRGEFKLQIDAMALTEIVELSEQSLSPKLVSELADSGAPIEDIRCAEILIALQRYMEDRHVDAGFEVVFDGD